MSSKRKSLLIISRDALLDASASGTAPDTVCRALARVTRKGGRVLLTAPEPDHWMPTRSNVDSALVQQQQLMQQVRAAGGDIEGVYYVPRSLFTQDRNRVGALTDILSRYRIAGHEAVLISSSAPFLKAAKELEIYALPVSKERAEAEADLLRAIEANT